MTILF